MPFTFSHPAIILPIHRTGLCLTGLIVGSLTPDFEYFIRMKIQSDFSHTFWGGIYFGIPVALILCMLFHLVIKRELILNLPSKLQLRLIPILDFNWLEHLKSKWPIVILSILIGNYSHVLWDSFTHTDAYFVNALSLHRSFGSNHYPIFKILQHGSTVLGGLYLVYFIVNLEEIKGRASEPNPKYWLAFILLTLAVLALRFYGGLKINQYGNVIVSAITASMISIAIVSLTV